MCGGYTRVCVRCGRCGSVEPRPIVGAGICVRCGHANDPLAGTCEACGVPLPKAPGVLQGAKGKSPSAEGQFARGSIGETGA